MYGYWVTMELLSDRLVVTPVNLLPVEREGTPTDAEILDQKKRILKDIVGRPNEELEADEDAMALVRLRLLYSPPLRAYIPSL